MAINDEIANALNTYWNNPTQEQIRGQRELGQRQLQTEVNPANMGHWGSVLGHVLNVVNGQQNTYLANKAAATKQTEANQAIENSVARYSADTLSPSPVSNQNSGRLTGLEPQNTSPIPPATLATAAPNLPPSNYTPPNKYKEDLAKQGKQYYRSDVIAPATAASPLVLAGADMPLKPTLAADVPAEAPGSATAQPQDASPMATGSVGGGAPIRPAAAPGSVVSQPMEINDRAMVEQPHNWTKKNIHDFMSNNMIPMEAKMKLSDYLQEQSGPKTIKTDAGDLQVDRWTGKTILQPKFRENDASNPKTYSTVTPTERNILPTQSGNADNSPISNQDKAAMVGAAKAKAEAVNAGNLVSGVGGVPVDDLIKTVKDYAAVPEARRNFEILDGLTKSKESLGSLKGSFTAKVNDAVVGVSSFLGFNPLGFIQSQGSAGIAPAINEIIGKGNIQQAIAAKGINGDVTKLVSGAHPLLTNEQGYDLVKQMTKAEIDLKEKLGAASEHYQDRPQDWIKARAKIIKEFPLNINIGGKNLENILKESEAKSKGGPAVSGSDGDYVTRTVNGVTMRRKMTAKEISDRDASK